MKEKVFQVKKTMILEGVSAYFEESGFYSATMQDIAKNLGLSVGALYKFFASKEELFFAYIEYQISIFNDALQSECAMINDPRKCLELFVQRKFEAFQIKRAAISDPVLGDPLFFVKLSTPEQKLTQPIMDLLAQWFEQLIQKGDISERDPHELAYLFNAMTTGYIEYWLNGGSLPQRSEEAVESFFQGFATRKDL